MSENKRDERIQPSADAHATAIAVAWAIVSAVSCDDDDDISTIKAAKKRAELVAEILPVIWKPSQKP